MSYIWEEYSTEKVFYVANRFCPYMEVFKSTFNDVPVNPLIRFESIFYYEDTLKKYEYIDAHSFENIIFHYLCMVDMCKGLDEKQILMDQLDKELSKGDFGKKMQISWKTIDCGTQNIILSILADKISSGIERNYFSDTLRLLFSESSIIYEKNTNTYYVYIATEKNKNNETIIEILKYLFWGINESLNVIWDIHYGIIGVDDTTYISEMRIV